MTLELPRADVLPPTARSEVRWMSPAVGLWVATRGGEHAGLVERRDGTYHARSARGRALGSFADLDSALAAIDGGIGGGVDRPQGAPRGVRHAGVVHPGRGLYPGRGLTPGLWAINAAAALALVAAVVFLQ